MGIQLIFVVETNKKCNSDWIYIKDTIEYFYSYERTQVKLSVVYMDGKGNYKSSKKEKEIGKLVSQYKAGSKSDRSKVIYCFDCDEYNTKPDDAKFLEMAKSYCNDKGYDFVWFCKDVEQVYIGKQVDDVQKKKEATNFKAKNLIKDVNANKLIAKSYRIATSNIMAVLDQYQELTRKN